MTSKSNVVPFVKVFFGSHLYHLDTPESDFDYKGIYMPTGKEIVLGRVQKSFNYNKSNLKNTAGQEDFEIYSFDHFVKMCIKGETVALDMLHGTNLMPNSEIWNNLVLNRHMFYSKSMNSFMGYLNTQFKRYGVKGDKLIELTLLIEVLEKLDQKSQILEHRLTLPTGKYMGFRTKLNAGTGMDDEFYHVNEKLIQSNMKIEFLLEHVNMIYDSYGKRALKAKENNGSDWKAISHAIRVAQQLRQMYVYGDYTYPLMNNDYILAVKQGKLDYFDVVESLDGILEAIKSLSNDSNLQDKVDRGFWEDYLYKIYTDIIQEGAENVRT